MIFVAKGTTFFRLALFVAVMVLFATVLVLHFITVNAYMPSRIYTIDSDAGANPNITIFSGAHDVNICYIDSLGRIHVTNRTADNSWKQIVLPSKSGALWSSVAVDPITMQPAVLYVNVSSDSLSLMRFRNNAWSEEVLSEGSCHFLYPSLAIDNEGHEHICYSVRDSDDVFYLYRDGSSFIAEKIKGSGRNTRMYYLNLVINHMGEVQVSFDDVMSGDVIYAKRSNKGWLDEVVAQGHYSSMACDNKGVPHLAYIDDNGALYHAFKTGDSWLKEVVARDAMGGLGCGIALAPNDRPILAYRQEHTSFPIICWANNNTWQKRVIDSSSTLGSFSIKVYRETEVLFAFQDAITRSVKYTEIHIK